MIETDRTEITYIKQLYEEKSQQLYEIEKKYRYVKRQKEQTENYCDKLILFITRNLPNEDIPKWTD
jgi:Spy/CpxP family protein refolding chaperone